MDRKIYIDIENKVAVAKSKFGDLVFTYITAPGSVIELDVDDRQIVDIYDLTDEETKYNKKIRELLEA